MIMKRYLGTSLLGMLLSSCGGSDDKPELIDKMKPVLVEMVSGPAVFGQGMTLDFHFISPDMNSSLSAEAAAPVGGPTLLPALTVESVVPTDYPGLRHFRVRTKTTVPLLPLTELVKMRYALVGNDGTRAIRVEGDVPAYPSAASEGAQWTVADAEILSPAEGAVPGKVDLTASVVNTQNEGIKVAWFVSGGELNNRRDATAEWELPGPGTYTAVLTVRGQKSRTGALRFRSVTYQ